MHPMNPLIWLGLGTLVVTSQCALAEPWQALESIQQAAIEHLQQLHQRQGNGDLQINSGALDARLALQPCEVPLATFMPPGAKDIGNTTVGVRCEGSKPWLLYVPVTVSRWDQVWVAAHPLAKQDLVAFEDLRLTERDLAQLTRGYVTDLAQIIGKRLKSPVGEGTVLRPDLLETDNAINKGQRVTLVSGQGGLWVSMPGKALEAGGLGERIEVQNLASKKVVEGTVVDSGKVQVGG